MNSKQIVLFITCYFTVAFSLAQQIKNVNTSGQYRAVNWGLDEGLSNNRVYSMIKDVNGFLWIGTTFGLNRFDGSTFKKYIAYKTKKNKTIPGNGISNLIEDSLHNIWIGTNKGLSCYDTKADTFRNIFSSIPGVGILPFWATKDEVFCWDNPEHQLAAYNVHTLAKRTLVKITPIDSVGFGFSDQYAIFDAGSNSLWMAKGFHGTGGGLGGLLQVSLTDGKRTPVNWQCYRNIPNHSHWFEGMRFDRKRNSILISSQDGLVEFSLSDKKWHHIDALNKWVNVKDFWQWPCIDIDALGRVWVDTSPAGIIIYDPANNSVQLPFANDSVQQKNVSDEKLLLYCSKDGMVWSGGLSQKGIHQIIPFSPAVKNYVADPDQAHGLKSNDPFHFIHGGQGTIWMSSPNGINIFNPHTGFFDLLGVKDLQGVKGGGDLLLAFNVDTINKKAWILTDYNEPYYQMDIASRICNPVLYEDSNGKMSPLISVLANHPENKFPIAYKNGLIIAVSLPDHQEILEVNGDPVARKILSLPDGTVDLGNIQNIRTNEDNLLFLRRQNAATNLTYARHDNNWICTPTPLDSIEWNSIYFNKKDETYWVIAETQLIQYDKNFRVIRKYSSENGMPGVEIHDLIPDNKGNIWFTTDRSIFQLNTKNGTITTLSEKDGFLPQKYGVPRIETKDDDGDLYITAGGIGYITGGIGFDRINPDKYVFSPSSVYFESLKINQQPFPLSAGINQVEGLSLKYYENKIDLETGIIDYYSKGKGRIRYKLEAEGKNADWQYAPAYNTIRYEGMPPGNYKLVLQSSNAANEFNGPEKVLLIQISPPFWQTWWFRIVAMLFAAGLLYGFIQYRSRNLKQRNIVLEEKVMQRTNELHNSLAELKTTQDQLIQSEKMASLGELTSGIAHEIKNPLNFINNFSEINIELITEIEEEQIPALNETNLAEITSNIKTLKKNSEKINHHGKRIDEIVKGMLQHSRLGNVKKEPVNINTLCDESLKLAYHGFRAKEKTFNASFETRFDPDLPRIMVIPQDFGRVLLNLINNAFYTVNEKKKRSQSESLPDTLETESLYKPSVIVSTKRSGNKIIVTVSDNGLGIPSPIITKIFQPFFTTKPTGEGTGLGLSMSYDIITKSHGGELRAKSKEGIGTDFEIILPV